VTGDPDVVTGKQARNCEGGLATYDEAWAAALAGKAELDTGRVTKPTTATVEDYFREWLAAVQTSLKPTTYANYRTNVEAYVLPAVGHRPLKKLSVPVLNALHIPLSESGRVKDDRNQRMYVYWRADQDKRGA
jgi:hypothetical protein